MAKAGASAWTVLQVRGPRGNRAWPGRNLAEQEIIKGFSLVLSMLDIELIAPDEGGIRKPNLAYYGLGTPTPKGKLPFRVRKRV